MHARRTSGLSDEDLLQTKIYMRTLTDALQCSQDMAEREAARFHYKDYVSTLVYSLKKRPLLIDCDGTIMAYQNDQRENKIFKIMNFTHNVA